MVSKAEFEAQEKIGAKREERPTGNNGSCGDAGRFYTQVSHEFKFLRKRQAK